MRRGDLPIVLGHRFKKGLLAICSKSGRRELWIARLKEDKEYESGEQYKTEDIKSLESIMWFEDKESVEQMIRMLQWLLSTWKENEE